MSTHTGTGRGYLAVTTCASWRTPASFARRNPRAPSPTWQLTHAMREWVDACHAVNCGCIGAWHAWPQNCGDSIQWTPP